VLIQSGADEKPLDDQYHENICNDGRNQNQQRDIESDLGPESANGHCHLIKMNLEKIP